MEEEIVKFEREFGEAVAKNDADAIDKCVVGDWIIIGPDGRVIDKERFLAVIRSGALVHDAMESEEMRIRIYENSATVTALTTAKGKYAGQPFTTKERATDFLVKQSGRWMSALTQLTTFSGK